MFFYIFFSFQSFHTLTHFHRDLPTQLTFHDIIKEHIMKRDHSVTFLPVLATIVSQHMSGQFIKSCSNGHRVLNNEESYRLIWESLQRLHYHHHHRYNRRFISNNTGPALRSEMEYTYGKSKIVNHNNNTNHNKKYSFTNNPTNNRKSSSSNNNHHNNNTQDEYVKRTAYEILYEMMNLNQHDIEYAIGPIDNKTIEFQQNKQQYLENELNQITTNKNNNSSMTNNNNNRTDHNQSQTDHNNNNNSNNNNDSSQSQVDNNNLEEISTGSCLPKNDDNKEVVALHCCLDNNQIEKEDDTINNISLINDCNDKILEVSEPNNDNNDDNDRCSPIEQINISWIDDRMFEC